MASPVSRTAILIGRLAGGVVIAMAQTLLFLAIGIAFGVRVEGGIAGVLVLLVLAALLSVAISGLGVFLALRTGSAEAVQGTFPLFFALLFFSSAFFPRETMSGWFKVVADVNPISYLVEAMRDQVIVGVTPRPTLIGLAVVIGLAALRHRGPAGPPSSAGLGARSDPHPPRQLGPRVPQPDPGAPDAVGLPARR